MSHPQAVTNAGVSDNVARQTALAEAIASNITSGRKGSAPVESSEEQAKPRPKAEEPERVAPELEPEPEPRQELDADESEAEGTEAAPEEQDDEQAPEPYSLADFADAAEIDVDTLVQRLEVEVGKDGEKRRASLREVLDGYRWNAANTQRAQELAEQRKQIEAQHAEVKAMHDRAQAVVAAQWSGIEAEEQALNAQYHAMPWQQLQAQGGGAYADAEAQFTRRRTEIEQRKQRLAQAYAQVEQERQGLAQRQQAEIAPREHALLVEKIPEWRDEARKAREAEAMTRHAVERYGFTPDELGQILDHRQVAVLHRLWQLEQQADGVPIAQKRVAKAPKPVKPGQRTSKQDAGQRKRKELRARLRRSGKRDDLAAMVLQNIRGQ